MKYVKDLDLQALNGYLNIEFRTDGGVGIYYDDVKEGHNTLMLNREHLLKMMSWLMTYIEGQAGVSYNEQLGKEIWNEAMEVAAKIAEKYESNGAAYEIRLEKKK